MTRKWMVPLTALIIAAGTIYSRESPQNPQFKYTGGTENIKDTCTGSLELGASALTFRCPRGSVAVPYSSITLMQYRPDVSRKIWKMKLKWKLRPSLNSPLKGSKRNRYFTILYAGQETTRAMVLEVSPEAMRPYLAEIDLKSGKRVEVKSFEEYD